MPFDMEQEEYDEDMRFREMNQGKSEEQVNYSNMVAGGSMVMMIVIIILSWLWKIIN